VVGAARLTGALRPAGAQEDEEPSPKKKASGPPAGEKGAKKSKA
jgi:hypothetical protein